jgi:general secretion pathway protein K
MKRRPRKRGGEEGYALVAAVASIGVFAAMALTVLSATRFVLADVSAEQAAFQAGAAADSGIVLALQGLLARDAAEHWSIDGRLRDFRFGTAQLRIRVEDERGKVPINFASETELTRLLEAVGLSGEQLAIARDSLLDWLDADDMTRRDGAERDYYAASGIRPPNGFVATMDELGHVRGFDGATIARLKAIATVNAGRSIPFDPRFAEPLALEVMDRAGAGGPAALDRTRDRAGQRPALGFSDAVDLTGRPLVIAVEAILPDGARARRTVVVELTGSTGDPYLIRSYE